MSDFAIAHVEDAVGYLGGFGVVGDHQDGLVELAAGGAEHVEDGVGVLGVEVAGGLVGEDDGGAGDEGAGDGDALLLAAGELVGAVIEAAADAEQAGEVVEEGVVERLLGGAPRLAMSWAISMLPMAERVGRRLKRWKTKPMRARRILVRSASESVAKSVPSMVTRAGGGGGEAAEDVEEGGFAGAGGADDGDELAGFDGEADVAEGGDFKFAGAVGLAEVLGEDDGRRRWLRSSSDEAIKEQGRDLVDNVEEIGSYVRIRGLSRMGWGLIFRAFAVGSWWGGRRWAWWGCWSRGSVVGVGRRSRKVRVGSLGWLGFGWCI